MSTPLSTLAKKFVIERRVLDRGPRPNVDTLVRVMVLIAREFREMDYTGRTDEMIEDDARAVMYGCLEGAKIT